MSVVSEKSRRETGGVGEMIRVVVHALILALVVRTLLFQPFNIPSGSMKDTLLIGDFVFVSKFSYGFSRYSIPFAPNLFPGRIMGFWGHAPVQGDVAVFKWPRDDSTDYIKRVIGLPGDKIQMIDGVLNINGKPVVRQKLPDIIDRNELGIERRVARYKETLPDGVSYETLDLDPHGAYDNTEVYTVPPGNYFMMGDNRDNSSDSRVPLSQGGVGYVPLENFVGKADIIFFSVDDAPAWQFWRWPWTVRFERLLKLL